MIAAPCPIAACAASVDEPSRRRRASEAETKITKLDERIDQQRGQLEDKNVIISQLTRDLDTLKWNLSNFDHLKRLAVDREEEMKKKISRLEHLHQLAVDQEVEIARLKKQLDSQPK